MSKIISMIFMVICMVNTFVDAGKIHNKMGIKHRAVNKQAILQRQLAKLLMQRRQNANKLFF